MVIFHIDKIKIGFEFEIILFDTIYIRIIDLQSIQDVAMNQEDLETVGE